MTAHGARQFGRHRLRGGAGAKTARQADYMFGAVPQGDGTVRFRVWAPGIEHVALVIDGGEPNPMIACLDGFHELRRPCPIGARYYYELAPGQRIPDPASRLQFGDVGDESVVVDTRGYEWLNTDWQGRPWADVVLYEIHVGLAGGFRGVQERLANLVDLGITAIELMPIADFPGERNWGYDGTFPYAPDASYGTPDDLRLLIDTAHGMGMMVFLDVVYNHFGPEGSPFTRCAPEFFRTDRQTPWGPAIDFRQPQVRAFFMENAMYWLRDYRFDGLRLDAIQAISDTAWLTELARYLRRELEPARHIHLVLEDLENRIDLLTAGFDALWNDDLHHVLHHLLTGESYGYYSAYADQPATKLAQALSLGVIPHGNSMEGVDPPTRPDGFVFFLQNHDQIGNRPLGERLTALCADQPERLRAAIALQLLTPQIPLLFMGEEYGLTTPFLYFTSFKDTKLIQAVRQGRRREFADFPGYSDPVARKRLPDPNSKQTWQNSLPVHDPDSEEQLAWRAWYAHVLHLRQLWVSPHLDSVYNVSSDAVGPQAVVARWRLGNGKLLSIYCNLATSTVDLAGHGREAGEHLILDSQTYAQAQGQGIVEGRYLPAACTCVTLTEGVASAQSAGSKAGRHG